MIKILLVGYGHMGKAMAEGWLTDPSVELSIISPELDRIGTCYTTPDQLPSIYRPDIIIFAVKPQIIDEVLPEYKHLCSVDTLVVSIAAGVKITKISGVLNGRVVRIMPNLPITTGLGLYGIYSATETHQDRIILEKLLSNTGTILWLETEDQIDKVTAISGSGPAYYYLFTESLQKAAQQLGFDHEKALLLAQATFVGAAELLKTRITTAATLRAQVTSPGGTTAAAIETFESNNIDDLVYKAVEAAYTRAKELSK